MDASPLDQWIEQWQARVARVGTLTDEEWAEVKEAIHVSYELVGATPPAAVIRALSPQHAKAMALAHQADQTMGQVNAAAGLVTSIVEHDESFLARIPFGGVIAGRVDRAGLSPAVWGLDLHPHMLRPPCTGNLRPGIAAEVSWLVDRGRVSQTVTARRTVRAIVGRSLAGPARLLPDLAFVSDLPTQFLRDDEGHPHSDAGAAITWSDGSELNFWHGIRVPADFFRWSPARALAEVNIEVRRCAFERLGVEGLEDSLTLLAEAPDPANPPHVLRLYDLPRPWLSGRLLVVDNASIDKGGHRRRFQIFVPPHITDPVEAAANSFGMSADEYRQLQRAT